MPRTKQQKPTEEQRLREIEAETARVIRHRMLDAGVEFDTDLAKLVGMGRSTLGAKLRRGAWKQQELIRIISALRIPPEEALRMLGFSERTK